uniref:Mucin-1 n=1 Tax=Marmota marmota marmota TaxID=9994 RepID=A0A8C5ZPH1_MARMA
MTPGIQSPFFLLLLLPVTVPPSTSSHHSSPSQVYVRVSFFSLSFYISNLKFNSSLENPRTNYYQQLQRNISELVLQVYKQDGFLGLFNIMFSLGLGYQAGALPCWCWSVFYLRWPSYISLPWRCVGVAKRTMGIWISFHPGKPTIL